MKLLSTHTSNPNNYIRIATYNLVKYLTNEGYLNDSLLRKWTTEDSIENYPRLFKEYYETISNTQ